ncbi:MAG TPA: radical SAM protein [Deltaproteobacteria bacterium]|jgi:putative pyruvate formate lyase activating enzyme|nr:radical SAM protein [Deltaproteobacteria bacterium]
MAEPSYRKLHESGALEERIVSALEALKSCRVCPRDCRVDRTGGETGRCRTGRYASVASFSPHFGEEAPLVGSGGSGTIFFSSCNLLCFFCQNYEISHFNEGAPAGPQKLAEMMLRLQKAGCCNINFVSPSHVAPQILEALPAAIEGGLSVPLIYNTGGYDNIETLRLLDSVIDIYMPDFKFWDPAPAAAYCSAPDYPEKARAALKEMHAQVGDLVTDDRGIAVRGLLVRHLVMPGGVADTARIMSFIAEEISKKTYVNVMDQYRPCYRAREDGNISRRITRREYEEALKSADDAGLTRLDHHSRRGLERFFFDGP